MEIFLPHLVQKLWLKIWSTDLGGSFFLCQLGCLGDPVVHTAGNDLGFNSSHKLHAYSLVITADKAIRGLIKWTEPKVTPKRNCNLPHTLPKLYQVILLMFKVTKIHQPTKKSKANLWSAFSWAQKRWSQKGPTLQVHGQIIVRQ